MTVAEALRNPDVMAKLRDPLWRLSSGFYSVVDKFGKVVPFVPNAAQRRLLQAIFKGGVRRWIVVKARQLGFSTLIELLMFDATYWTPNFQASLVDQTQADASKKLKEKCGFAFEKLDSAFTTKLLADSGREMRFVNGSAIVAGMNARGGTNHFLHVSELGPIAFDEPKRAEEIRTGALPTVPPGGMCFIESTFKGGKGGFFYELIKQAQEVPESQKTEQDFRLMFSPWFEAGEYTLRGDMSRVSKETHEYLDGVERQIGRVFTPGQRLWYQVTAEQQGIFMLREYPSTIEECFRAPVEGAIYAEIIAKIRAAGQIYNFNCDRQFPVYCSWDIGFSDTTDIWWFQLRGNRMDVIKHVTLRRHSASQAANAVRDAGMPVALHLLPHDAGNHSATSGKTYVEALTKAGLLHIKTVPRTSDIWIGINQVRDMLPRCSFNLAGCADGISALEVYHTKDEFTAGRVITEPVHDWSSHPADGFRTAIEAINAGMVSDSSAVSRRVRRAGNGAISAAEGFRL